MGDEFDSDVRSIQFKLIQQTNDDTLEWHTHSDCHYSSMLLPISIRISPSFKGFLHPPYVVSTIQTRVWNERMPCNCTPGDSGSSPAKCWCGCKTIWRWRWAENFAVVNGGRLLGIEEIVNCVFCMPFKVKLFSLFIFSIQFQWSFLFSSYIHKREKLSFMFGKILKRPQFIDDWVVNVCFSLLLPPSVGEWLFPTHHLGYINRFRMPKVIYY